MLSLSWGHKLSSDPQRKAARGKPAPPNRGPQFVTPPPSLTVGRCGLFSGAGLVPSPPPPHHHPGAQSGLPAWAIPQRSPSLPLLWAEGQDCPSSCGLEPVPEPQCALSRERGYKRVAGWRRIGRHTPPTVLPLQETAVHPVSGLGGNPESSSGTPVTPHPNLSRCWAYLQSASRP